MIVPIHTFEPQGFPALFGASVDIKEDGQWWDTTA